jgi:glycosyltransferase involved in cell wall biosynthesis
LRVSVFSAFVSGGAGHAALRVHQSLLRCGADSRIYVGPSEQSVRAGLFRLEGIGEGVHPEPLPGHTIFSVDAPGIPSARLEEIIDQTDVFSLHWCARFLSLRNIAQLSRSEKPVVMTIRDKNPLTGGCHVFHGCENWKRDCLPCPQLLSSGTHLPSATLEAKRELWNFDNITVVVLSEHTRAVVQESPLFRGCRVETIPNPIDTSTFKPYNREQARAEFELSCKKHVIAYLPSFDSSAKGSNQAVDALRILAQRLPADDCVLACATWPGFSLDVPCEIRNVGYMTDKEKLARFYSAADVTLIPSMEETFSNTAAESVACGTPIVGFETGAIPEIAQGNRGYTVPLGDVEGLAEALANVLSMERASPSELYQYVSETFSPEKIGRRYVDLFTQLRLGAKSTPRRDSRARAPDHRETGSFNSVMRGYLEEALANASEERRILYERLIEVQNERDELRRLLERGSWRGRAALLARASRMFLFDNRSFWSHVRDDLWSKQRPK